MEPKYWGESAPSRMHCKQEVPRPGMEEAVFSRVAAKQGRANLQAEGL